jgi:NAD-dependent DNA ligase
MEISATSSSIKPSNTSNTSNNENTTQTTIALGGNEPGEVGSTFEGKTFVIHGYDVNKEQALRAVITKLGGEIESSVTENVFQFFSNSYLLQSRNACVCLNIH